MTVFVDTWNKSESENNKFDLLSHPCSMKLCKNNYLPIKKWRTIKEHLKHLTVFIFTKIPITLLLIRHSIIIQKLWWYNLIFLCNNSFTPFITIFTLRYSWKFLSDEKKEVRISLTQGLTSTSSTLCCASAEGCQTCMLCRYAHTQWWWWW